MNSCFKRQNKTKGVVTMNLIIEVRREGYSLSQISKTLTVGELIEILDQYEDHTQIFTSHDNGYTFGGLREQDFSETDIDD